MLNDIIYKIQGIKLIWKLLIPFLLLSFAGTSVLVYVGLKSQHQLIKQEERKEIREYYKVFNGKIRQKEDQALSMATIVAKDRKVQEYLVSRNREGLLAYLSPVFSKLRDEFHIKQLHFHIPPGRSFVRFHRPDQFGEDISYREAVVQAIEKNKKVAGVEKGLTGLGIRGVVPVIKDNRVVGSVEIGYPFAENFLKELKNDWGPDFSIFGKKGKDEFLCAATTLSGDKTFFLAQYLPDHSCDTVATVIAPRGHADKAFLLGPIRECPGEASALVQIQVDRSEINEQLIVTRNQMIVAGVAGIAISFLLIWLVATLFTKPIKEIVKEAKEIAEGERETRLEARPEDEIGFLTRSLNTMLDALKERQIKIEDYARTLEDNVKERTRDLVLSEEKYRVLVENLPLIVYRILDDGTTEFINSYFTEKLGYEEEEVVGDRNFWKEKICGRESGEKGNILDDCWKGTSDFRTERSVKDKKGRVFTFIDHAMPQKDEKGKVRWIDGIMEDITELKSLQERALRTEEIRTIGEISSRFAHEMRNPLATVGGFARRLFKHLPENDRNREFARVILDEVKRLEEILRIILSSIKPIKLSLCKVDVNEVLGEVKEGMEEHIKAKGINLESALSPVVSRLTADEALLRRALESLLKNAVFSMPEGERLLISTHEDGDNLLITLRYPAECLSDDDLEQFFLPRITFHSGVADLDLPLAKVIIHRHFGEIDVSRDNKDIVLVVKLPFSYPGIKLQEQGL